MNLLLAYLNDDSGAVTVDWVVLTAAIVGLGIAVIATVSDGTMVLADKVSSHVATKDLTTSY